MHDADGQADTPTRAHKLLLVIGSAGMLLAMATDAIAVLGRHIGFGFLGSIEIFQVAAVVALSSAILLASLQNRHARVDLILGRVSERKRAMLAQIGRLALALTFGLLTAGSLWVAIELWPTHEMTESLSIRIAPFRAIWILSCALATTHFIVQFVRGLRA